MSEQIDKSQVAKGAFLNAFIKALRDLNSAAEHSSLECTADCRQWIDLWNESWDRIEKSGDETAFPIFVIKDGNIYVEIGSSLSAPMYDFAPKPKINRWGSLVPQYGCIFAVWDENEKRYINYQLATTGVMAGKHTLVYISLVKLESEPAPVTNVESGKDRK